jgi:hypothetical protein
VLELQPTRAAIIGCFARSDAVDAVADGTQLALRVAPDELLLVVDPEEAAACVTSIEGSLAVLDPGGLTFDLSGGYRVFRVRGDWGEAFARLCAAPLPEPPAILQALFAHVPAKVVVSTDELLIVVSSVVSHHVRDRILAACRDLGPRELAAAPLWMSISGSA